MKKEEYPEIYRQPDSSGKKTHDRAAEGEERSGMIQRYMSGVTLLLSS